MDATRLLRDGVKTARAGNREQARDLFEQVIEREPHNETAWLWLAGVTEEPKAAVSCLERVLNLNPNNERARTGLQSTRLQAGIAEAKAGNREAARLYFAAIVEREPKHEAALLWLAGLAATPEESLAYVQRVLAANPAQARAQQLLAHFQARLQRKNLRVLLAIDDPKVRVGAESALHQDGFTVTTTSDGHETLEWVGENGLPDLIVATARLPGIDGHHLCQILRKCADTRNVPVILMTSKNGFFERIRNRLAGAVTQVPYPFAPDQIVSAARKYCRPHE
jgi:twitching motility two-component system response regulator PilG